VGTKRRFCADYIIKSLLPINSLARSLTHSHAVPPIYWSYLVRFPTDSMSHDWQQIPIQLAEARRWNFARRHHILIHKLTPEKPFRRVPEKLP